MRYTKMHGAGNSFILLENLHGELQGEDFHSLALRLCDKKTDPGADGLIVVVPARDADFGMLFYNADGSLGEMCGNGARCIARYGVEHGLARDAERVRVLATAGLVTARRVSEEQYEIRLNDPSVAEPARIACVNGEEIPCAYVELGDPGIPHAVVELDESAFDDLDALRERGRALRHAAVFPRGRTLALSRRSARRACARSPLSAAWRILPWPAAPVRARSQSLDAWRESSPAARLRSRCPAGSSPCGYGRRGNASATSISPARPRSSKPENFLSSK